MSKRNRHKTPFYLRRKPKPEYDIRLLRPPSLPLGERFETLEDALNYSLDSEHKLDSTCQSDELADRLNECRTSDQRCGQPHCAVCALRFRVWFIGELLRLVDAIGSASVHIMTILLKGVPHDKINSLDLKAYDAALRKRLSRSGLNDAAVIGGYENLYRAKSKTWVLHINLVVIDGTNEAINQFKATFSSSGIAKPVIIQKLRVDDRPTQLSYILKFTTYHRPFVQRGSKKGPAVSLNPREHCALVAWMAQSKFQDFMFMFNARRRGTTIVSGPRSWLTF
jgi:hypothetical protein